MQVRPNAAKETLSQGGAIFSSAVRLPEPGLCEILGYAGFDFVLLDNEHGALSPVAIDRLVQGCLAGDTVPIVRVLRNHDPEAIMLALDLGAQGILLPHCRTAQDARDLQQAAYYAPQGNRGFGPGRGNRWGGISKEDYFAGIDDSVLLIALIEDIEGVENVKEISATGLDVLWTGTGDLAMAYGVPGERDHPKVLDASKRILDACLENGVAAGFPARHAEDVEWAREKGYRAIGFGGAENLLMAQSRSLLSAVGR